MAKRGGRRPEVGARPGTLHIAAESPPPRIRLITYTAEGHEERAIAAPDELIAALARPGVHWIDVQGHGDEAVLQRLGEIFTIHPLALEDVVHVHVRPKAEPYDEQLLLIIRMLSMPAPATVEADHVGLILGSNWVVSFQQHYGDVLDPVRDRIRRGGRYLRTHGADYLAYAILDTIVDAYYPIVESIGEALESMEHEVLTNASDETLRELNRLKNVLLVVRRSVAPMREAVNSLVRDHHPTITDEVRVFLRDTYDHCVLTLEATETGRELVNGMLNTYLTVLSNRMNEIMKVLTIVSSLFVPLTFLAGIYGMNFEHMPELRWRFGYPVVLLVMAALAAGMVAFFWRRGWIGGGRGDAGDG